MSYGKQLLLIGVLCMGSLQAMEKAGKSGLGKAHKRSRSAMCSVPVRGGDSVDISGSSITGLLAHVLRPTDMSQSSFKSAGGDMDYVALDFNREPENSQVRSRDLLATLNQQTQEEINAIVAMRLMTDQLPEEAAGTKITVAHKRGVSQVDALAYELLRAHITAEELAARLSASETEVCKNKSIVAAAERSHKVAIATVACAGAGLLMSFITTLVELL